MSYFQFFIRLMILNVVKNDTPLYNTSISISISAILQDGSIEPS